MSSVRSAPLQFNVASTLRFFPERTPGLTTLIRWLRDLDKSERPIRTTCYKGLRFEGSLRSLCTFMTSRWTAPALGPVFEVALSPGDTLADVGGFYGIYALFGARLVGPTGRVHTFEPIAESVDILRRQVDVNGFSWVEVVNTAVGAEQGDVTLQLAPGRFSGGITSRVLGGEAVGSVEAPVTTLDDFFAGRKPPQLIKIDVEGMEPEVLRGAVGLLGSEDPPLVVFEADAPRLERAGGSYAELVGWLRGRGYEVWALTPRGLAVEPIEPGLPGSMNLLAGRPERHEREIARLAKVRFMRNQND